MALGLFQPSVLGMAGQSHALDVIGANIANATTGGYKRTETGFQTVLSRTVSFQPGNPESPGSASVQSDLGGVRAYDVARITEAGEYAATGGDLDIAIAGRGFFVLESAVDGSGTTAYGRDGQLARMTAGSETVSGPGGVPVTVDKGYLVDKNGWFLQGWQAAADCSFPAGGALTSLRVDPDAFASMGEATSFVSLALNLPADDAAGAVETYGMGVFDSAATEQALQLSFTKSATAPLTWTLAIDGTPVGDMQFDATGALSGPRSFAITRTFANGAGAADDTTASFALDVSGFTQFAGDLVDYEFSRDGFAPGALTSVHFDPQGDVVGLFDNGRSRPLYRLALADFANADGLDPLSGNIYAQSTGSGAPVVGAAGQAGMGRISPGTLEQSNVDLNDEFSRMIMTQKAYNSAATAFRTLDEMTEVARDLYR